MSFQQKQYGDISPLNEVSQATVSPGAVATATTVGVSVACTILGGTVPATFAMGDQLEVFPPAAAALAGISVVASPTATVGTAAFQFTNATGGSITPVSGVYRIVATRLPATMIP